MVGFHLCYDLVSIKGMQVAWFSSPLQDVWRASISWTFLLIAGCMCSLSRDNLRRSGLYLLVAATIFVVTSVAAVDTPISFGIIFCMGACTLVEWLLEKAGSPPRGYVAATLLALAFLALLPVPRGSVSLPGMTLPLPGWLYSTGWLSWLGFPGPLFASGDYYPVLPYLMLYLAGAALGRTWHEHGYGTWCADASCAPVEFVGRHALLVYVLHQPILLLLSGCAL